MKLYPVGSCKRKVLTRIVVLRRSTYSTIYKHYKSRNSVSGYIVRHVPHKGMKVFICLSGRENEKGTYAVIEKDKKRAIEDFKHLKGFEPSTVREVLEDKWDIALDGHITILGRA